jgi:hypothetical protein
LLIEQPGPWGLDALCESRLDPSIGVPLARRAAVEGLRTALIRRPRRVLLSRARRFAVVDSRPGLESVRWGSVEDAGELADLPLDGSVGTASDEPVYLVCTHGRHDTCCALRGRPVAAGLAAVRPEATWECSHIGGDRFAPNLVALPHGLYYAHVGLPEAVKVVEAYEGGRVEPEWLRGRSCFPAPVQAAQHHARLALGEFGVDALRPLSMGAEGGLWTVRLAHDGGQVEVRLREASSVPARLTCRAARDGQVEVFHLVDIRSG